MAESPVRHVALEDLDMLQSVVDFKDKFYHRGWARYDLAVPGTMALVPPQHVLDAVRRDYDDMRFMIYGHVPEFEQLMGSIRELEEAINQLALR